MSLNQIEANHEGTILDARGTIGIRKEICWIKSYHEHPILDARDTIGTRKETRRSNDIIVTPSWMLGTLYALEKKHGRYNHIMDSLHFLILHGILNL